jgi:hypothetical protein
VIFLTFSLLLFCGLGIPVSLLLPKTILDRMAAAPVFGLPPGQPDPLDDDFPGG